MAWCPDGTGSRSVDAIALVMVIVVSPTFDAGSTVRSVRTSAVQNIARHAVRFNSLNHRRAVDRSLDDYRDQSRTKYIDILADMMDILFNVLQQSLDMPRVALDAAATAGGVEFSLVEEVRNVVKHLIELGDISGQVIKVAFVPCGIPHMTGQLIQLGHVADDVRILWSQAIVVCLVLKRSGTIVNFGGQSIDVPVVVG